MKRLPFSLELKKLIPPEAWPWLLTALRQDSWIWAALESTPLGERALESLPPDPAVWTPAALGLLALDDPISPGALAADPMTPAPPALQSRADQTYQAWLASGPQPLTSGSPPDSPDRTLANCALIALALRERYRESNSWRSLFYAISLDRLETRTVLACLYGMIPEPERLLHSLAEYGNGHIRPDLALHALLCQPLAPESQTQILKSVQEALSPAHRLDLLTHLAAQRPEIASELANDLLLASGAAWSGEIADDGLAALSHQFDHLANSVRLADCYQIAGQPERAVPVVAETLRQLRRLRGHLSARLARVVAVAEAGNDDGWRETAQETSLEAWKQAVQLLPEEPQYVAGLARTLIACGRLSDAQSYLAGHQADGDYHPSISLAAGLLSARQGEHPDARRFALQALRLVESGQALSLDELIELARLFAQLEMPGEAARAAQVALVQYPLNKELLTLLAQAQNELGKPELTLSNAYAAQALSRSEKDKRLAGLILQALEAIGAWELALDLRLAKLREMESPALDDLHAVMRCAEQAGRLEHLMEASQRALAMAPEDVLALRGLAQVAIAQGDFAQAIDRLNLATRLAPEQPNLWLSLVEAYRAIGDQARALEALRSASLAVPDHAEIHAALGQAYRARGALTQALECFRRAAKLSPSQSNTLLLGQTLLQLGHIEEACNILGQAYRASRASLSADAPDSGSGISLDPFEVDLAQSYARALAASKQIEAAIPLLLEAARARPEDSEAGLEVSRALLQSADQPANARRAIPFLQRILGLNPDGVESGYDGNLDDKPAMRAEARALLAEAYSRVGEWKSAMQAYRRALDDPLNREPQRQTRLSTGLGLVALKLDQPEMAVAALQDAAQAEPMNVQVLQTLSEAYLASGLAPDAFQTAIAVRNLLPDDLNALEWFLRQGAKLVNQMGVNSQQMRQEIVQTLRKAVLLAPERADLQLQLGRMLAEEGDAAGALEAFQHMAEADEVTQALPASMLYPVARTIRELGNAPLAIHLLERAVAASQQSSAADPPLILADLLTELSLAQHQVGADEQALQAADQALAVDEDRAILHAHKAEILQRQGRLNEALESLRNAVRLSPRDPELRLRMTRLLDQRGDLSGALEQAEKGLALLADTPGGDETLNLHRTLSREAAGLARATLRPRLALDYLKKAAPPDDPAYEEFSNAALRAELSLEVGDLKTAEDAAVILQRLAPDHPRSLALAARFAHRRRDEDERDRRCRRAVRSLLPEELSQEPITMPSRKEDYIAAFLATAQAAIDSRMWEDALAVLDRLIEVFPETPLAYYLRAQVLAARAEAQLLFQELEVTSRDLGSETLSDQVEQAFDQNLAEAQRLLAIEVRLDAAGGTKLLEDEGRRKLATCMARGKALFQPDLRNALVLQSLLQATTPQAPEVAALIMAFRRCGERDGAVCAAQVGWRPIFEGDDICSHPLVLTQVALSQPDAMQAVAEARDALEFAAKQGDGWPELPMLQYLLARTAYNAGDYSTAMQAIMSALAAWPDESRWQEMAARIYLAQDVGAGLPNRAQAIGHLQQAVTLEPERAGNHLLLGQLYLEEGQTGRAVQSLQQAVQLGAAEPKVWLTLAQAQFAAGELEQAAVSAERAIENNPEPVEALLLRGQISLRTNNPRGALSRAQAILRLVPEHVEAIVLLSQALEALDRPSEALVALDKALSLSANPLSMQIERVHLVRRSKGLEAGVAALQELVAQNPQQPALMALLAEWLNEADRPEAAAQAARLAIQEEHGELSEEQRARLHLLIGLRMRSAGQLDQAIYHLSQAVEYAPAELEAYLELGRAYQERREYRQALKTYQRAMAVANGDYRPYYQAGLVLKDSKDYAAAEAMLRRASQLAPTEVSVHRLLGAVVALNLIHNRRLTRTEP